MDDIQYGKFNKRVTMTTGKLIKKYKTFRLNFDLAIQRNDNIWDLRKQSLLIHSLIFEYYVPPIVVVKQDDSLSVLDGKQRLTTIIAYTSDDFALDVTTPNVGETKIAGLLFSQLPKELQQKILNFKFDISMAENLTDEEIENIFYRLNNGVPLNTIEMTRALLGNRVISFLKRITSHPFFEYKINISSSAKKRYTDQELVLQILKLIYEPDGGLNSKDMKPFVKRLKDELLKDTLKSTLDNALFYLNEAFPQKKKFLKKINIPMLVLLTVEIISLNINLKITTNKFGAWAEEFFTSTPEEYKNACQSGSASKDNVQKRLSCMREHFYKYFNLDMPTESRSEILNNVNK